MYRTSHGVEKRYTRSAVFTGLIKQKGTRCVILDVPNGCVYNWIIDGVFHQNSPPKEIIIVNDDYNTCVEMSRYQHMVPKQIEICVMFGDVYEVMLRLSPQSVSAVFLDHNQSPAYLEKSQMVSAIQHACAPGAYVAITASQRAPSACDRLLELIGGLGDFDQAPFTYGTKGPMCFVDGRLGATSSTHYHSPCTANFKRKRSDESDDGQLVASLLRDGVTNPSKDCVRNSLMQRCLVEVGAQRKWLFVFGSEETIDRDRYTIKYWNDNRKLSMQIKPEIVHRLATDVPSRFFDSSDANH